MPSSIQESGFIDRQPPGREASTSVRVVAREAVSGAGMVAAEHPLAAKAGLEVLQADGNAVDAAVTAAFAMNVLEPGESGLGGGGIMVVHRARQRDVQVVDFAMDAPGVAKPDLYPLGEGHGVGRFGWRKVQGDLNIHGHAAASVPGQVRGLALALDTFGTIPLAQALQPAIRHAREGFRVEARIVLRTARLMPLLRRYPASARIFLPDGYPLQCRYGAPAVNDLLVQEDLACALESIAQEGPDVFYEGWIAEAIVKEMAVHGGLVDANDLARYRASVVPPQWSDYHGLRVAGAPGPCGCFTAQQSLNMLEEADRRFDLRGRARGDAVHVRAEVFRRAFADRYAYGADANSVPVPFDALLGADYARARTAGILMESASDDNSPGNPWQFAASGRRTRPSPVVGGAPGRSTTHICAADRMGNMVTLTQTLADSFGCGVVIPGTGVLMNNAMQWFDPEPGRPNSIGPGKRGMHNMTPLLVMRKDSPFLAVGAPGGVRIINAVTQVIGHVVDDGMNIQDAISAPRMDCSEATMLIDARFGERVISNLTKKGHRVRPVLDTWSEVYFAKPLGILAEPERGGFRGGVDALHGAIAVGF